MFNVLVEHAPPDQQLGVRCRCPLVGDVLPVDFEVDASGQRITAARVRMDAPDTLARGAPGIAWVLDQRRTPREALQEFVRELWVALRGDFVLDLRGRAVDAEFVRAELPTGDRPAGSDFGVQGGVFDSWFELDDDQPLRPLVNVSDADRTELLTVPGIGLVTVDRIEAERASRPFESVEDLRTRVNLSDAMWERMRDFITVRPREG